MVKKKILFLTFKYPYGSFGASTHCSTKIMKALQSSGKYEIHCCSHGGNGNGAFDIIPEIIIHKLPIAPDKSHNSTFHSRFLLFLQLPIYPLMNILSTYKHYKACKEVCKNEHFDLVIAQCFPQQSVLTGTLLKKFGYIDKLMVIFWDNIYGNIPKRVVPLKYALHRQRIIETFIARHADSLVSLYPLKAFHEKYGDVPTAEGKRFYLGIPKIILPMGYKPIERKNIILEGDINILYSGNIFRKEYVEYLTSILNQTNLAQNINLIFFSKGISKKEFDSIRAKFKGTIQDNDWIPVNELLNIYHKIDFFISFPGVPTAIRSKCYEYMSYGTPILLLYDDENDVNISNFSKYPLHLSLDIRIPLVKNVQPLENFIENNKGKKVAFAEVETLFERDSPIAYTKLIDQILN